MQCDIWSLFGSKRLDQIVLVVDNVKQASFGVCKETFTNLFAIFILNLIFFQFNQSIAHDLVYKYKVQALNFSLDIFHLHKRKFFSI